MSLTKEECERALRDIEMANNYPLSKYNDSRLIDFHLVTFEQLIEEHFELIKEKEAVEKALDKTCELIKEAVSQDCTIFDKVTLDNLCWIIKRGELKEWCLKDVE